MKLKERYASILITVLTSFLLIKIILSKRNIHKTTIENPVDDFFKFFKNEICDAEETHN